MPLPGYTSAFIDIYRLSRTDERYCHLGHRQYDTLALLACHVLTVREVAEYVRVPVTQAASILASLEARGLIAQTYGLWTRTPILECGPCAED